MKTALKWTIATALVLPSTLPLQAPNVLASDEDLVKLRFLETTDLHTNITNYDYFQDKVDETIGLTKTATLIKSHRIQAGAANTFLFDNGDTIQGTPFGDYIRELHQQNPGTFEHPMYKAMASLDYDAVTLGNHEFNFGLEFLYDAMEGSKGKLRFVNSNVKDLEGNPIVSKFNVDGQEVQIIERTVTDTDGETHTIKVGVFGVVPPKIMSWDSGNLQGRVTVDDIIPSAREAVSKLKDQGADVVVALAHSGIGESAALADAQLDSEENVGYALTKIDGLDMVMTGHQHGRFPDAKGMFASFPNVDNEKGLINGKPVVMANNQGKDLGVIDFELEKVDGKWQILDASAKLDTVTASTPVDAETHALIDTEHRATIDYINRSVGEVQDDIQSYFALVRDDASVQFVTNAQQWYVEKELETNPDLAPYKGLPLLSAGAPFKAGGRELTDAGYYTNIPKGQIALKNVADLYVYPNTLEVVKVTGADVMDWLEMSAGVYNEIDADGDELLNLQFRSYNFDILDGLTYEIDVTGPAKYDGSGKLLDASANRVKNVEYDGKAITMDQEFLVATNNYRAGSSSFPGLGGGKNIVYRSAYETRNVISDYIIASKGAVDYKADDNWKIVADAKRTVKFETADAGKQYVDLYEGIEATDATRADAANRLFRTYTAELEVAAVDVTLTIDVIKPGAKQVTGVTAPGAKVTLKDGNKVLATTTAQADGTYKLAVKPLKLRQSLTVVSELNGQTMTETKVVGAGFVRTPALSSKYTYTNTNTFYGKSSPGASVTLKQNGKTIGTVTADDSGSFKFTSRSGFTAGKYEVTSKEISGKVMKQTAFTLKKLVVETPNVLRGAKANTKALGGRTTSGATVVLKDAKGKKIAQTKANWAGWYTFTSKKGLAKGNYTVIASDYNGSGAKQAKIVLK
ncbi:MULTISPECIES: bifunctional 2',3'-cyclic-nucleotide 2'-phosphodiesterase/3'-nucleotidase [unclassified Exiguobacterium]|uniref:bifunctional 2',3'-cyclic-nucleotide 2'-phosphodiesterase/3'-nucleotidase n=1 Tax=unclassified Exiguobacterium TaxID=2644629 RepID=UPI00103B5E59|nr:MULTISPECIES: bifunctional 2',3'-cyclic-nucleotide 2'-phosphodiesterase/3'-nucleotidase [unclassified Exiguobacterium]TCI47949.1 bifunctional 2',3'-cyclic-nucleotide 2'-phosphodiesterase/3'-nucleotidase [Exiguobacterium sp. SH5S32]TCI54831.1 bifunctional 2',3'-cyclic-nucleotide 2'-phosphodiesterase/3'-nucleotidase [Exiguobacterium sp. SH1S4]TCI74628.1 bifunctional 2',3'-cyclic-nucleotide 2'-phosphodiesterase/3'-nucleotidase [Exiguobacterium sp. SH1S1]